MGHQPLSLAKLPPPSTRASPPRGRRGLEFATCHTETRKPLLLMNSDCIVFKNLMFCDDDISVATERVWGGKSVQLLRL